MPSVSEAPVLAAEDLTFGYRRGLRRGRPVLDGITWEVDRGRRTALLGPNGAGKSTLLCLLAGNLRPTSGRVQRPRAPRVAFMPQDIRALRGVSVQDQVAYAGWLAGLSRADATARAGEVLDVVELGSQAQEQSIRLSGGQRRRMGLAEVLVAPADVLLLDEPTAGLDPAQRQVFHGILASAALDGRTLVVSTHQLDDLDTTFDRVALLGRGRLLLEEAVADFRARAEREGGTLQAGFRALVDGGHH